MSKQALERVGHYRVLDKIGAGGMGEVYRAVDERLGRRVALKLLPMTDASLTQRQVRLVREAQAAGYLNHPGIVTIHDVGRHGERNYVVMELVEGVPLKELCGRIDEAGAVGLCAQAAEALAAAHTRGILHRDLKPDNMMVTPDARVKVLDFGLAKLRLPDEESGPETSSLELDPAPVLTPTPPPSERVRMDTGTVTASRSAMEYGPTPKANTPSLTRTGAMIGTPVYMAPEQAARDPYDQRSEVYCLGLVLFELISGKRALERGSYDETVGAALAADIPPLRTAKGGRVSRGLARVLARALAHEPAHRFRDMNEMAAALRALERHLAHRPRRRLIAAGAVVVAAAGGALLAVRGSGEGSPPAPVAEVSSNRRLTFDPGCEARPTFMPDGRALVFSGLFERDVELIRLDLASGKRRRLTSKPGWDVGPAASPDGRRVAFVHFGDGGRELHVLEDGKTRLIGLLAGMPGWTTDGDLLYGDDSGRLLRLDFDRQPNEPVVVARLPDLQPLEVDAFPDGTIVFQGRRHGPEQSLLTLGIVEPTGQMRLLDGQPTASSTAGMTADRSGRGFYYVVRTPAGVEQLVWRDRAGTQPVLLPGVPAARLGLDLAPGGGGMVLSTCREMKIGARLRGDAVYEPFEDLPEWAVGWVTAIDRRRMLVGSDRSGRPQIWLHETGRTPRVLVDTAGEQPVASARELVWVSREPGQPGIFIRSLEGGEPRQLTDGPGDVQPLFSPDGRTVYFLRTGGVEDARAYAVSSAGGAARPVSPQHIAEFVVSPIDGRLAFIPLTPERGAVMIGPPGGPFEPLPDLPPGAYWSPWFSRDGKRLLIVRGGIELLEVPLAGGGARRRWSDGQTMIWHVEEAPDGDGLLAAVMVYEGDLVLLHGRFR
jgi:serine/threonine protein kinase